MDAKKKRKEERPRVHQKTGDRVKIVLKEVGISQRELKRRLQDLPARSEVNSSDISDICNGYDPLTEKMAKRINKLFPNYSVDWLLARSDYRTAGDAFRAHWEEKAKPSRDRRTTHAAVASMMALCGLFWDGDSTARLQPGKDKVTTYHGIDLEPIPGSIMTVDYNNVVFDTWELATIADKVFEYLRLELEYAVRIKKGKDMDVADRQPIEIHFGKS